MKKIARLSLILSLLLCSSDVLFSQETDKEPPANEYTYYFSFGPGFGVPAPNYQLQWAFLFTPHNKWGYSASFRNNFVHALHQPADYDDGLCILGCREYDQLRSYSLGLTRFIPTASPAFCFTASGEMVLLDYKETVFVRNDNPGVFDSNYFKIYRHSFSPGAIVRIGAQMRRPYLGIELNACMHVNNVHSFGGFEVNMMFGKIRSPKPKK